MGVILPGVVFLAFRVTAGPVSRPSTEISTRKAI
jgi:hypothetical protein